MAADEATVRAICGARVVAEAELAAVRTVAGSLVRDGQAIRASFAERGRPPAARVTFGLTSLSVRCTCYTIDRFCPHVAAVLLLWARDPQQFAGRSGEPSVYSVNRTWNRVTVPRESPSTPDARADLRKCLNSLLVADLRNVGRRLELQLRGTSKSMIVDQVLDALSDPVTLERVFGLLRAELRVALGVIYALSVGGLADAGQLELALNRALPTSPGAGAPVGELSELGLIYPASDVYGNPGYQVPLAFGPLLPRIDLVAPSPTPSEASQTAGGSLGDSLSSLWASVRAGELSLLPRPFRLPSLLARAYPALIDPGFVPDEVDGLVRSGKWTREPHELAIPRRVPMLDDASLAGLTSGVGQAAAADFAWHLLAWLGLIQPGELVTSLDESALNLLWRGPAGRLGTILRAWESHVGWSEMDLALSVNPGLVVRRRFDVSKPSSLESEGSTRANLDLGMTEARGVILRFIGLLPEGTWLSTESLLGTIWRLWPEILYGDRRSRAKPTWWMERDGRRLDPGNLSDWRRGPGEVVTALVAGPLNWLGLVDIAGPPDHPTAFRLRPESRLLRRGPVPEETAKASIELGPNLEVRVVPGSADPALRDLLTAAGTLLDFSPKGLRYELKPEGVHGLFAAGQSAESLLALLGERARAIPDDFRSTVERWSRLYGQARLYENLTLVELGDDHILAEMLAATSLRRHLLYQFSPRLLAVDPAGADELFSELRTRGYMPLRLSPDEPAGADGGKTGGRNDR